MPAVTVTNPSLLPRVAVPPPTAAERPVQSVTTAPRGLEGEGFPVHRAFHGVSLATLDPFIHMDQMGEVEYGAGEPKGTPWHPHRGFETVTYMIDGTFQHRDSIGGGGLITNGDTQWMTAGAGILHIERPPDDLIASGGLFHGIQLWVNLPRAQKWAQPRYQDINRDRITLLASSDAQAYLRLIAGSLAEHNGPGVTHTPITIAHVTLFPGARLVIPWNASFNALAYGLAGSGSAGSRMTHFSAGQLVVFGAGDYLTISADEQQDSRSQTFDVLLLGGQPISEPVAMAGPFVMNTDEEIRTAFADFRSGKMGTIPTISANRTP